MKGGKSNGLNERDYVGSLLLLLVSLAVYVFNLGRGVRFNGSNVGNSDLLNYLAEEVLIAEPISAIWGMHAQPPLLNSTYAIAYLFEPHQVLVLQMIWLALACSTPLLLYWTLVTVGLRTPWSLGVSALYAIYPNTLGYAFSAYSTTLIQFLFGFLLFAVARAFFARPYGCAMTAAAFMLLTLARAPFVGLLTLAVIAVCLATIIRSNAGWEKRVSVVVVLVAGMLTLAVQLHVIVDFRQFTTGSLGGFSTLRVLNVGLNSEEVRSMDLTDCQRTVLVQADNGTTLSAMQPCVEQYGDLQVRVSRAAERGNEINSRDSLLAAIAAREVALSVVRQKPLALVRGVVGRDNKPGSWHYFVSSTTLKDQPIRQAIDNIPFFAALISVPVLLGGIWMYASRQRRGFGLFLLTLFIYVTAYSLLTEILENDRYKHEAFVIYFAVIGMALFYGTQYRRAKFRASR